MTAAVGRVPGLPNVYFSHPQYAFDELAEHAFVTDVLSALQAEHPETAERYDIVVFADEGTPQSPPRRPGDRPAILWHISDEGCRTELRTTGEFAATFRCYLPSDRVGDAIATPLGTVAVASGHEPLGIAQRPTTAFFSGNFHSRRVDLYCALRGWPSPPKRDAARRVAAAVLQRTARLDLGHALPDSVIRFTTGFMASTPEFDYVTMLESTKIALCPEGAVTNETFRHAEALRAGCVVVSSPLPDTWYYRDSPIIQISDWRTLPALVQELSADVDELERVGAAGRRWWRDVGSPRAVARFIAAQLGGG